MLREPPPGGASRFRAGPAGRPYARFMEEYDEPELIEPDDFLAANPFPADARMMGFDRWSDEGALIAVAANLDPGKWVHKAIAWVWLLALMTPVLMTVWFEIRNG